MTKVRSLEPITSYFIKGYCYYGCYLVVQSFQLGIRS